MKITALFVFAAAAYNSGHAPHSSHTVGNWGSPAISDAKVEDVWGQALNSEDNQGQVQVRNGVANGESVSNTKLGDAKYGAREIGGNKDTDFSDRSQHFADHVAAGDYSGAHFDGNSAASIAETQDMAATAAHTDNFDRMHGEQGYNNQGHHYVNGDYQDNQANLHSLIDEGIEKGYKHSEAGGDGRISQAEHDKVYLNTAGTYSHGDFGEHGEHGIREKSKDQASQYGSSTFTQGDVEYDPGVAVPRHCIRRKDDGLTAIEVVPYGWTGVGHGKKYCFLEVCNACTDADAVTIEHTGTTTHLNSDGLDEHATTELRGNSDKYCNMVRKGDHADDAGYMVESEIMGHRNGQCGIKKSGDDLKLCEYVTCTYSQGHSMEVTVHQEDEGGTGVKRALGRIPENSPYQNGRQHECRPQRTASGWDCSCYCFDETAAPDMPSFAKENKQA